MKRSPPTCRRASAQGWLLSGASRHSPAGRVALGSDEPQQRAADVDDWSIPDEAVVSLAAVTLLLQAEARGSGRRCSRLLLTSEGNWSRRADWRRGMTRAHARAASRAGSPGGAELRYWRRAENASVAARHCIAASAVIR
jgi:hypothetical protein